MSSRDQVDQLLPRRWRSVVSELIRCRCRPRLDPRTRVPARKPALDAARPTCSAPPKKRTARSGAAAPRKILQDAAATAGDADSAPVAAVHRGDGAASAVKAAEDAWNSRDADRVAGSVHGRDSVWRNRDEVHRGRAAIEAFLERKWAALSSAIACAKARGPTRPRIGVRFQYEWHDASGAVVSGHTATSCGSSTTDGFMRRREASINDVRFSSRAALRQAYLADGRATAALS